ncbi:MAG: hypothetical protein RSE10_06000 [Oscillospiraceae bacterium]
MLNNGFIILYRSILGWEWYDDINTKILFLHLVLTVNYEDKPWHGMVIKRGQRVCSLSKLAIETGLSIKNIRTALDHLKQTGEVAHGIALKSGLFTVNNYDIYQQVADKTADNGQANWQANGKPLASEGQQWNKANKDNKANKEQIPPISPKGESKSESESFSKFWNVYPRKKAKANAIKAFDKLKADDELLQKILVAISKQKEQADWQDANSKYIPYPATWLNGHRWEDDVKPTEADEFEKARSSAKAPCDIKPDTPRIITADMTAEEIF